MNAASLGPAPADAGVPELARAIAAAGGRLLVVGGWVRDSLRRQLDSRARAPKDIDLEVFGLSPSGVDDVLSGFGSIGRVGRQFPVWRLAHRDIDISYPREAALEYHADADADQRNASLDRTFAKAARHRDLTINAMGWDPLEDRHLDPYNGADDLRTRRLRAVDAKTFGRDALRGLRIARLVADLEATVDAGTVDLCRALDWSDVPIERQAGELRRLLMEPAAPSLGFAWLADCGLLSLFPLIEALRGTPQDPQHHPEGDVFVHTLMVIDQARAIGAGLPSRDREALCWSALCHDFGKPATTTADEDGRVRSLQHDSVGAELAGEWLRSLRIGTAIARRVEVLVADHLAPAQFVAQKAGPGAYRRLARRLSLGGATLIDLERLARADHLGRTTEDARRGRFEAGRLFLEVGRREGLQGGPRPDVVGSEHLFQRGFESGPRLGQILERTRELQDKHGWTDPERLIDAALQSLEHKPD